VDNVANAAYTYAFPLLEDRMDRAENRGLTRTKVLKRAGIGAVLWTAPLVASVRVCRTPAKAMRRPAPPEPRGSPRRVGWSSPTIVG